MDSEDQGSQPKLYRREVIRGEPYKIGGRTLVPEAQVVSWGKASATLGNGQVGGWGGGFAQIRPLAFVELTKDGERLIPVTDETASALRQMLGRTVALVLLFTALRFLARRGRRAAYRNPVQPAPKSDPCLTPGLIGNAWCRIQD